MTQVPPPVPAQPGVTVCYRHPKRETGVHCVRCDRPICPDCMNPASVGFQCPECVSEGKRTQRQRRTVFGGTTAGFKGRITIGLIAINVVVEILAIVSTGGKGLFGGAYGGLLGTNTAFTQKWSLIGELPVHGLNGHVLLMPYGVADGDYYRLITSIFVHYGLLHLATNMWGLWIVGRPLESALGPVRYLTLYLTAGIGGSVAVYVFQPQGLTAGASGAVFGLFAAFFVILRRLNLDTSFLLPVLVINIIFSFSQGVSLAGHIGGAVTGAVVAVAMAHPPREKRTLVTSAVVAGLFVLFALTVVLQTHAIQSAYQPS